MSHIVYIDCEFTGPDPIKNAIVEIGATMMHVEYQKEVGVYNRVLQIPPDKTWNESTVETFWLRDNTRKQLYEVAKEGKQGTPPQQAIVEFVEFLKECWNKSNQSLSICSDSKDIDCTFMNIYLTTYGYPPLHLIFGKLQKVIDTDSYYLGMLNISQKDVDKWERENRDKHCKISEAIIQHYNFEYPHVRNNHRALNDARYGAIIFVKVLSLNK